MSRGGKNSMNPLEQLMKNLEEKNEKPVGLKIEATLIEEHLEDFVKQIQDSKVKILCLSSNKKADSLLRTCEKISKISSLVLTVELPFHRIFSYGLKEFAEEATRVGISGFHVLELPYEEQGQLVVHLLDADAPCILQEVTVSSGDRIPTILEHARGFVWCSDKGYSKQLSELPGDYREYYLFAVDAVSPLPVLLDFGADSEDELKDYLDSASGFIVGSALEENIRKNGYSSEIVAEYCRNL
jgi:tryptophan synthase alpha chain